MQAARQVALIFPVGTGLGVDRWHPRHFALLPDKCLEKWVDIMMAAEGSGYIPSIMNFLAIVFIPKGTDSVRPIGFFTASLRLLGEAAPCGC